MVICRGETISYSEPCQIRCSQQVANGLEDDNDICSRKCKAKVSSDGTPMHFIMHTASPQLGNSVRRLCCLTKTLTFSSDCKELATWPNARTTMSCEMLQPLDEAPKHGRDFEQPVFMCKPRQKLARVKIRKHRHSTNRSSLIFTAVKSAKKA